MAATFFDWYEAWLDRSLHEWAFDEIRHRLRENPEREMKIGRYLRGRQNRNGSWSLYHGGPGDMSATVKAYFALKLMGHSVDAPYMVRARHWVLTNGGAENVNVFTRITLAIFGK